MSRSSALVVGRSRAQSSVLGVALLFGITVTVVSVVVVFGGAAVSDLQGTADAQHAESSMTQLDSQVSRVALGGQSVDRVDLGRTGEGGAVRVRETGWMNVTVDNSSGVFELTNATLGSVVYEQGEATVVYQGGGVWRRTGDGSRMVSPPEFHYRETTLTLPLVTVSGTGSSSGEPRVEVRAVSTSEVEGFDSPLEEGSVSVTVGSSYYEAWGRFFETRTDGTVEYDHDRETATLRLVTPTEQPEVTGAIISNGGAGTEMELDDRTRLVSYNRSEGQDPTAGVGALANDARLVVTGDLVLDSGNVKVNGNVLAGGHVEFDDNQPEIKEDVLCAAENHDSGADVCVTEQVPNQVKGDVEAVSTRIEPPDPATALVENKVRTIQARNDNDETANVSSDRLDWSNADGDVLVLENGSYYLREIQMADSGNQELVLDTSDGDIELAVDGDVDLDDTTIAVRGDGVVRTYATVSDATADNDLDFTGARVEVRDPSGDRTYNASRFWLYAPAGIEADLKAGSRRTDFTGVIYAPDSDTASGAVQIGEATVNGAVVAHVESADTDAFIYFDEALTGETSAGLGEPDDPQVTHMHITTNEVELVVDD